MTYKVEAFKAWFLYVVKAKQSSLNTYNSYLQRIDKLLVAAGQGGLDQFLDAQGPTAVLTWAGAAKDGPFETYPSHARSVTRSYVQFRAQEEAGALEEPPQIVEDEDPVSPQGSAFGVEKEMQAAVRKQLGAIEPGLSEVDGGVEASVATGKIDILARDASGRLVVIELKAGMCPPGAVEQVLGYAQALLDERGEDPRAMLIAADFSDRTRAAAKRARDLELRRYEFQMLYKPVE